MQKKVQKVKSSSTKEEIILMFKRKGSLTVSVMAVELGITEIAVRRHISDLEKEGLLKWKLVRQPMGRPVYLYMLTEKGHDLFPNSYADVSIDFLKDLERLDGKEKVEQLFQLREARMVEAYKHKMEGLSLEEKIEMLVELQNKKGYMATWEKIKEGQYFFKEYNCPISLIAREYPDACSSELSVFQQLLEQAHVECNKALAKDGEYCIYSIKEGN